MNNLDYKELIVWQKAMDLVELTYTATKKFPKEEIYGLTSQIRRCVISIPSNIAEGSRRKTAERQHFLRIAFGSASEFETQIEIAKRLNYIDSDEYIKIVELLIEVLKMLNKMIQY